MPSRRVVLLMLASLVLVNLAIRYPFSPHTMGTDTFTLAARGQYLTDHGTNPGTADFVGYLGFYPGTYPGGMPSLLSAVEQLTGLGLDERIYLMSIVFALVALLASFALAHSYFGRSDIALLVALMYSTMPVIIAFTNWQATARGPLYAILPLAFWAVTQKRRHALLLAVLLTVTMMAVHRSGILFIPTLLGVAVARLPVARIQAALRAARIGAIFRSRVAGILLAGTALFCLMLPFMPFTPAPLRNFQWLAVEIPRLLPEQLAGDTLRNLGIYLAGRWGASLLFLIPGIALLLFRENKRTLDWVMILNLILLTPFIAMVPYSLEFLSVLVAVAAARAIVSIVSHPWPALRLPSWPKVGAVAVTAALLAASSFTVVYRLENVNEESGFRNFMTEEEHMAGVYLAHQSHSLPVCNHEGFCARMVAVGRLPSELDHAPSEPPVFSWAEFQDRLARSPVSALKQPFESSDAYEFFLDREHLKVLPATDPRAMEILAKYDFGCAVVKRMPKPSPAFFTGLPASRYATYANSQFVVYDV